MRVRWNRGFLLRQIAGASEIFEAQLQPPELRMVVVLEGECDIDGVSGQKILLSAKLGHAPGQSIPPATPFAGVSETKLHVLVFDCLRREEELGIPCDKHWLRIAHAKRLQLANALKQIRTNLIPLELSINSQNRDEISLGETLASIHIEMGTQLLNSVAGQGESNSMGVPAKSCEQFPAGLERL